MPFSRTELDLQAIRQVEAAPAGTVRIAKQGGEETRAKASLDGVHEDLSINEWKGSCESG